MKYALVTGAGGGMGYATARQLRDAGYTVFALDRAEITPEEGITPISADVTDENLVYENGCIKIGDRAGLGIELNEETCLEHPYVEHNLRHYTGALTDILLHMLCFIVVPLAS